jgi:hypothetical protein
MNRFRIWAGGLHWGQILLLVPTLLFAGVASGVGAIAYVGDVGPPLERVQSEVYAAENALREFRENPYMDLVPRRQQIEADLVRAVEEAKAAARTEYRAVWVRRAGLLGWALAWLTAFLSLWWWFGARAKSGPAS